MKIATRWEFCKGSHSTLYLFPLHIISGFTYGAFTWSIAVMRNNDHELSVLSQDSVMQFTFHLELAPEAEEGKKAEEEEHVNRQK